MPTTGQFFFATQGATGADTRIVSLNNDGTTQFTIVDNTPTLDLVTSNIADIGLDTAAGFYFAIANGGADGSGAYLIRGSIAGGGPATIVADFRGLVADPNDDILVTSLAVDTINNRIYVGYQDPTGGAPANTGIRQYSYNPLTGAITDLGFLTTVASSGKGPESGFSIFLPTDFEFNASTGRLFFSELLTGGASANGVWRVDVASPNTVIQVVSQTQFPDNGSAGFIKDVELDTSTGLLYFSTESQQPSPSAGYVPSQNAIWFVSQNGNQSTAVKLTITGLPGGNLFYPGDMVFDQATRQLYVESEEGDIGGGAPNDVIYVLQLDAAGSNASLVRTIVPNPAFSSDVVNIQGMAFNTIPVLGALLANATAAIEQSANISLLTGAPTLTDDGNRLSSATVQITGGTFNSNENSINDDNLAVGAGLQVSGLVAGTNITVTYTRATSTLSLTGYDTIANYQSVLNSVRYFATGNNPTNYGANTTRTLTWTVSDGATGLSAGSPNTRTSTLNIGAANDAPTSTGLQGDSVTTTEPAGTGSVMPNVKIDAGGNATIADADNLNFSGGSIRFAITSGLVAAQDQLVIDTAAATTVTVAAGTVSVGGTAIGTVTGGGAGGADLLVSLNASATPTLVQTLIRAIDFANTGGDNPTAGARTITTTLIDGSGTANGGLDTLTLTSTVNVVATNDVPTITGLPASLPNFTPGVAGDVDLSASTFGDAESSTISVILGTGAAGGTFTTATVAGVTIGGTPTAPTFTGTIAAINAYFDTPSNVRYTPLSTFNGSNSLSLTVSDGSLALAGAVIANVSFTPVSIAAFGTAATQDFNALANSGTTNELTLRGWALSEAGTAPNQLYAAGNGSSNAGDTYSFGTGADRALGGVQSGTTIPTIGAAFTNNTGGTITSLLISYTGEQWRLGATLRTDQLDFQYSTSATGLTTGTWTDVNALDFVAPVLSGTVGALDGNAVANRTAIASEITGLNIAPGATVWLRWNDFSATGADDGLAIDDFSITARSHFAGADTAITLENQTITNGNLFANDVSAGGAPALSIASVNGSAANVGGLLNFGQGGSLRVNADGTFTFNPVGSLGNYNYLIDAATAAATGATNTSATLSFNYTLAGATSAAQTTTVTITINGVAGAGDQLRGGAGNDTITGTGLDDYFNLSQGGTDTATGGAGNDAFYFGTALSPTDNIDGGPGTNDQLAVEGNYGGPTQLGANVLTNVEVFAMLGFDTYNFISVDQNVAAGQELVIFAGNATGNVTFDGSAETDGRFRMYGGSGTNTFTGGSLDDGFYFGPGKWGASDVVNGGGGTNDQLALDGDYTVTINANANVETLVLLTGPAATPNTFNITLADAWTLGGATKTVWGLNVTTGVTINGSGESNGNLVFFGGQAADTLTGGAGADAIYGGGGGDALRGNGGADIFRYDNVTDSFGTTNATRDQILDFTAGDKIDLSRIDAITGGADDALSFIGSAAFGNVAGQLRFTDVGGGVFNIEGDVNGDGVADFAILVTAGAAYPFAATDFVL